MDSSCRCLRERLVISRLSESVEETDHFLGLYITLEDGRVVMDAVGGAAVTCIGNGHPDVIKAVQDQVEKLSCMFNKQNIYFIPECDRVSDVYNMQLSNDVAERLAAELVASGNGAFELCGFVAGGKHVYFVFRSS